MTPPGESLLTFPPETCNLLTCNLPYAIAVAGDGAPGAFFLRRIAAEIRVTTNPTGKTSMKVMATLKNGLA